MKPNRKNTTYYRLLFAVCGLFALGFSSCYDEKMEWNDPYTHPAAKDLPLELQEAISRYEALNAYTQFTLGVAIDINLYMSDEKYRNIINENFDEITPGNEMKQASVMNGKGELNFATIDKIFDQMKNAGLTVYGHVLVWHTQQQAAYLNSLIAPTIIPGTPGSSLIVGSFEAGMAGWEAAYYKENYSIVTTDAVDGTHSLQVIIPSDATGGKYDGHGQLNSPDFPIIAGHHYQISFWIKGSAPGKVAIDFPNKDLGNQYPWVNGAEFAPIGTTWTQVIYNNTTVGETAMIATTDNNAMHVRLLLASVPDVTYLIDGIEVIDMDAETEPVFVNLVANGTFDKYAAGGDPYPDWNAWGGNASPTREISAEGEGHTGGKALIIHSAGTSTDYGVQATTKLTESFIVGHEYHVEAMMRSSVSNGSVRIQFQGGSATYLPADDVSQSWTTVSHDFTAENENNTLVFDLGKVSGDYYIDKVLVYDKTAASAGLKKISLRGGPTTIEKTPEEKTEIIGAALESWISRMVGYCKENVHTWEVVNEPMNDNGTLRTSEGATLDGDDFYWADYLGKDYAVTAFKLARQYGKPNDKLFINDFGLESPSGVKLNGLLDYVQYIESKGVKIDGIGTQMHLNINWSDTTGIKNMFEKLGKTGKWIKVTELDITISNEESPANPISPTATQYAQQADLYKFVVDMYMKYIPEDKRYGITVWGASDNEKYHQYWKKNDKPFLWNDNHERKHAYKGFADGLAGRDVSKEFSGELQH